MSHHNHPPHIRLATKTDVPGIVQLFYNTIHTINRHDYTPAQIHAWAPHIPDETRWATRLDHKTVFVAETSAGFLLGFAELDPDGHIDCFYCHHASQRQGVGRSLLKHIEQTARQQGTLRLFTEASITARPFFERRGFRTLHENQVVRNGVSLINFAMEKILE